MDAELNSGHCQSAIVIEDTQGPLSLHAGVVLGWCMTNKLGVLTRLALSCVCDTLQVELL
jgi:hypothetical protein